MPDLLDRLKAALADRYRVDREIGRGGMAHVFLAQDLRLDRAVALKVLRPELAAVLGGERFLREIELCAKLTHPHILPIHDSGRMSGWADERLEQGSGSLTAQPLTRSPAELLYYVMPYVEGESLRDRLRREKQLPVDDALQISREVADALSYAHAHGVIHRDIKPENILLESGHAVVADFGIARAVDAAGGERLTEPGVALGTPAYMSPEQAAGSKDLDGRSDLYSLGCVLYEMLAGQPPFPGPTVESMIHQHLTVEPRNITAIRPAVPAQVAATLQRALAKTPADRFNPVALFAEALGPRASAGVTSAPASSAASVPRHLSWGRITLLGMAAVVVIAGAIAVGRWIRPDTTGSRHPRTAVAVLPFQNLSAGDANAYFAGGLHDEVLTQLSKVAALKVISRTSVMGYEGKDTPLRQIATELGVGSVVEGSVQVVGERLRVNVQLIDAATDEHLWAERYDRTLDDAFAIQSDVAQQIVAAVGAVLSSHERRGLAVAPTANAEAYQLYLQAREYRRRPGRLRENLEIAQRLYEQALALDSDFVLAYAELSEVHGWMQWLRHDPSPARVAQQVETAEAALRLAPDLPEAHLAMGLVQYWARRDYAGALAEFHTASRGLPNDEWLTWLIGSVHRRLGNWDEVYAAFERAAELDPRDADLFGDLGGQTYQHTRRYAQAVQAYDRALTLAPDFYVAAIRKGWAHFAWRGQLDTLRAALARTPAEARLQGSVGLLFLERQGDSVIKVLRRLDTAVLEGGARSFLPTAVYAAWAHRLGGDRAAARAAFDSARVLLDSLVRERADDWRIHAARGLALAGLGRRAEALAEAGWLQQSVVYREDAFLGPYVAQNRAQILAEAAEVDAALDEIERLLAGPSGLSVYTLRLDPRWDPIRHDPRFQALLVKYANPEPVK